MQNVVLVFNWGIKKNAMLYRLHTCTWMHTTHWDSSPYGYSSLQAGGCHRTLQMQAAHLYYYYIIIILMSTTNASSS